MLLGIIITASVICVLTLLIAAFVNSSGARNVVEKEMRREKILEYLPGTNCGACGCDSCAELAMKIATGECPASACRSGGAAVAQAIGVLTGGDDGVREPLRAQVMCSCTYDNAGVKYEYDIENGVCDCAAVMSLGGGEKNCRFACIGMGSCQKSCPYGAIDIINGAANVDYQKCTGCGICTEVCPKHLIKLIPYDTYFWVGCSSKDPAKRMAEKCSVGCSGCGKCEKLCPEKAIKVKDNVAEIDYNICTGCGVCYNVCPEGIIWKADTVGVSDLIFTKGRK